MMTPNSLSALRPLSADLSSQDSVSRICVSANAPGEAFGYRGSTDDHFDLLPKSTLLQCGIDILHLMHSCCQKGRHTQDRCIAF